MSTPPEEDQVRVRVVLEHELAQIDSPETAEAALPNIEGLLVLASWNLRQALIEKRRWYVKLWAVVLVLSAAVIAWVAFAFKLVGFGTTY